MGNINSYATDTDVTATYPISLQKEYYDTDTLTVQSKSDSIISPPSSVPLQQNSDTESEYEDPLNISSESSTDNNYNMDQNYELFLYAPCNEYDADDDDAEYINLMPLYQSIGYHTMPPTSIATSVITYPLQHDNGNEAEYGESLSVPSEWETDNEAMLSIPTLITDPLLPQKNSDNDNDDFGDQDVGSNDIYQQDANNNLMVSQQHINMHQDDGQFEYPPWDQYDDDDLYNGTNT